MKKENKVVEFVKEHKKEIIVGVILTVVGGTVMGRLITADRERNYNVIHDAFGYDDRDTFCTAIAGKFKGCQSGVAFNVPIDDLGEFGKKLIKNGVNNNSKLRLVYGTEGKWYRN